MAKSANDTKIMEQKDMISQLNMVISSQNEQIIHNSYEVMIDGRVFMRERHGIKASLKGAAND